MAEKEELQAKIKEYEQEEKEYLRKSRINEIAGKHQSPPRSEFT